MKQHVQTRRLRIWVLALILVGLAASSVQAVGSKKGGVGGSGFPPDELPGGHTHHGSH